MSASPNTHLNTPLASDINVIWQAAIDRYEQNSMTKVDFLSATSVDDIVNALQDKGTVFRNFRHSGSKFDKFRTLVTNIMNRINIASPPSAAIFVAIRYVMSAVVSVSADYDKIIEFFEDLDSYLSRLKVLEVDIDMSTLPELKSVLIEVLVSVLDLCGISAKHIRMKRIGEDEELASAYARFHRAIDREEGVVRNATLVAVNRLQKLSVENNRTLVEKTERVEKLLLSLIVFAGREAASERDNVLEKLSTHSFHEKQRDTFEKHSEATGQWLLESTEFQQWFNGNQSSVLWCYGIPGAGKSVFTSIAVNYVNDATHAAKAAVVYLYIDHKNPTTHSEFQLLANICRQLAEQIYPIPSTVRDFLEKNAVRKRNPSEDEWVSLIVRLCSLFAKVYLFVDALDECPERNRHKFLHSMKKLEGSVRFFFTSRPHIDDLAHFTNLTRVEISASGSDIETYLELEIMSDTRLCKLLAKDWGLKDSIIQLVKSNAAGMFLLASLQMELLRGHSSLKNVRIAMNALTADVGETYHSTMERIKGQSPQDYELAQRALSYIFRAMRPLNVEELRHILGVELQDTELDQDAFPDKDILLGVSAGLIRVDEKSGIIGLVHHTLHEFFSRHPEELVSDPDNEIANVCLTYLSFDAFESGPCSDGDTLSQRMQEYRLLDYAAHNWGYHVQKQLHKEIDLILAFLEQSRKLVSFVQILHVTRYRTRDWYDRFPRQFGPLHAAAYWGLEEVLGYLLEKDFDVDEKDSKESTPLLIAAMNGRTEAIRFLLDKGANINALNHRGESALYWAARNAYRETSELLLKRGADLIKDDEGWSALNWVILNGDVELARVLFDSSVDLDAGGDGRNEALFLAAEEGKDVLVQMLLDNGAYINARDWVGSTALDFASTIGHEATVRVLLRNNADINSRDEYCNSALHWALSYEGVVHILVEGGADVNAKNDDGHTPLCWSAQSGATSVAEILLNNNADVNSQDISGLTALHKAALGGYESMIQLLLKHGAEPNLEDKDGWTPLHCAVVKGHDTLVQLLEDKVEHGRTIVESLTAERHDARKRAVLTKLADKKAQGSTALTGLRFAAQEGQIGRIQSMLEKGADINARDAGGCTALELAVFQQQMEAAVLLLEHGADPNKCGSDDMPPLFYAIKGRDERMVRLLIEHGANVTTRIDDSTLMHLAVDIGTFEIVQSLIDAGGDIHAKDISGQTALHFAAANGQEAITLMLVQAGANLDDTDYRGRTPLMLATESLEPAVVKLLLDNGASIGKRNRDGYSAIDIANILESEPIMELLLECESHKNAGIQEAFNELRVSRPSVTK
ncbi:tankyrase, putative [Talaromyces stipitatus ATCC 10500]|uniref:Tankyrase, putative n=1 Tax=Talaromyces stipitatus (strain ATCC 10500 / CBS 375.48 / QM 6759 / NRRL 1006) TaxID=441959 RepID=B8MI47_TALSN|nr:tankyrase, putative [Talaromyces stipitatus ATCC 10500]EED17209.1 tankyrase, putative [Talaromyces stipitatus ATCC 10500]